MKQSIYILLLMLISSAFCTCKAKGGATNPLDTNTFDSVAVGTPLELDTTIGTVPDKNIYQSPQTEKINDSLVNQLTDSGKVDTTSITPPQ